MKVQWGVPTYEKVNGEGRFKQRKQKWMEFCSMMNKGIRYVVLVV
ncbi:hypothetical protein ACIQZI_05150 [Peribacillus sp. NPDC096379]